MPLYGETNSLEPTTSQKPASTPSSTHRPSAEYAVSPSKRSPADTLPPAKIVRSLAPPELTGQRGPPTKAAPPLRSALRAPKSTAKELSWTDDKGTQPLAVTHHDDLKSNPGAQEPWLQSWKTNLDPETPWTPRPVKQQDFRPGARRPDVKTSSVHILQGVPIPTRVKRRMMELDYIARLDFRGRQSGKVLWDGNREDDPSADHWDAVWGSLPLAGVNAAVLIEGMFGSEEEGRQKVETLVDALIERQTSNEDEKRRSVFEFAIRANGTAVAPKEMTVKRLCLSWFADTYRSVAYTRRMTIVHRVSGSTADAGIGPAAQGLLWLEHLARQLWRQRLFTAAGVDLHGNCLRLVVHATFEGSQQHTENAGKTLSYDLDLHIFMWGGPTAAGRDESVEEWCSRLSAGAASLRSARTQLTDILFDMGYQDSYTEICRRRKLLFRPGYTVHGVHAAVSPNAQVAMMKPVNRHPKIVIYPENLWEPYMELGVNVESIMSNVIAFAFPHEVAISNIRQYQWNTPTDTPITDVQLLTILRCLSHGLIGKSGGDADAVGALHTVKRLDLAGFLPLRTSPGANPTGLTFFPLNLFPALTDVLLPSFTSFSLGLEQRLISMSDLLVDPSYGILDLLARKWVIDGPMPVPGHLNVHLTVSHESEVAILVDKVLGAAKHVDVNSKRPLDPDHREFTQFRELLVSRVSVIVTGQQSHDHTDLLRGTALPLPTAASWIARQASGV